MYRHSKWWLLHCFLLFWVVTLLIFTYNQTRQVYLPSFVIFFCLWALQSFQLYGERLIKYLNYIEKRKDCIFLLYYTIHNFFLNNKVKSWSPEWNLPIYLRNFLKNTIINSTIFVALTLSNYIEFFFSLLLYIRAYKFHDNTSFQVVDVQIKTSQKNYI